MPSSARSSAARSQHRPVSLLALADADDKVEGMTKATTRRKKSAGEIGAAEMQVAEKLKQLRLEKGLTLSALATAVGYSIAFLSRVENHRVSIPIAVLEKLAGAMGVSISAFFEDESDRVLISLCRKGEGRKAYLRGPRGFAYKILVGDKKGKLMEPIILDVASVPNPPLPRPHSGEEFNFILDGECDMIFGKQTIRMKNGDAIYYDARIPHGVTAVNGKPCRMLAVVASRDYLFHGDLDRLLNNDMKFPPTGGE